jgi:filamentous hemagglutinin family protein
MIFKYFRAFTISCIAASSLLISDVKSDAQISPDTTLPNNSSVRLEGNTNIIEAGTAQGINLFHSFKEFSVNNGSEAFFNNPVNIQNIITRVTGKSISNIDGLIKANGASNLFLINPNGIVFGQNARLDIGGSFLATSANSMIFESGFEFSASDTESKSLLTITAPVGLQFGINPGSIQIQGNDEGVRSEKSAIIDTQNALRVQPNKTLALVGGDINLEGATLKTAGGRIELGSVAAHSLVRLTPINKGFALSYGGVQNFGNIQLSQQATVDASGEGAGDAQVQGRRITITSGSEIQVNTIREKQGGNLIVNATESLEVSGFSALEAIVYPEATGNAANLTINTRELLIRDGTNVRGATFGGGKGGNLTVTADTIQVIGRPGDGRFDSYLTTQTQGTGDAALANLSTILDASGSSVKSLLSIRLYIRGEIEEFIGDIAPIIAQFLGESRPALTAIGVSSLASKETLVEIEATAALK